MKYHRITFITHKAIKDINSLIPFYLEIGDTLRYNDIDWIVEKKVAIVKDNLLITFVALPKTKVF